MRKCNFLKVFVLSGVVLFTSCEPAVEHNRIIQNNSDFEVKILTRIGMWYMDGTDTIFSPIDTITIGKNTSKRIAGEGGIGTVRGSYTDCVYRDSMPMIVYFNDSIKVFSNVNNMNYWNFRIIEESRIGGGGISECRMILTNDMLRSYTE